MNMTAEGLALIKEFEGFRERAYRCPGGELTIGYGHTQAAGPPPVAPGDRVSRADAEAILAADVERFAGAVRDSVRVDLADHEFAALVSFAYNVGTEAFLKSSVLAAVNAEDRAAVPRRLQLWVKAGGRVLPGLVRRRAAEAALFLGTGAEATGREVSPLPGKAPTRSTTLAAAMVAALAALLQAVGPGWRPLAVAAAAVVLAAALWIARERLGKMKKEGV
jgi:lysozyme